MDERDPDSENAVIVYEALEREKCHAGLEMGNLQEKGFRDTSYED